MSYWKSLTIAVAMTVAWIMGDPATAAGPAPRSQVEVQLRAVARLDSLLSHLRQHPDDVTAMELVAGIYAANESYDAAIGPLARALQLDPTRRSLWSALDNAVKHSGRGTITDVELARRAREFGDWLKAR